MLACELFIKSTLLYISVFLVFPSDSSLFLVINTLKLVFDNRIYICNDCNICKVYRLENTHILDKL